MGDGMFIVLVLLVLGGYYVFDKVWDAGSTKLNRSLIQPKTHAAGQLLVATEVVCATSLPPRALVELLEERVPAVPGQPRGFKGQLYCTALDETGANYAFANSLGTTFTAEIDIRAHADGSEAVFHFLTWEEMEGIVQGIEEMERLAASVTNALSAAHPGANVEERPVQGGQSQEQHPADLQHHAEVEDPGHRPPPPDPSPLAFSSFPGLAQAHTLGPLPYRVMWEALSRPDGVRRSTLSAIIDRPRAEVDAALDALQEEELVDVSAAGLIRSRLSPA